mgnify:CR=1 FL=1|jgi:hypothetical protein
MKKYRYFMFGMFTGTDGNISVVLFQKSNL